MNTAKKYSIAYKGLSQGEHTFDFEVEGDLFRLFENPDVKDGNCHVKVNLSRSERQLRLAVSIRGSVVVECDRCLGDCVLPIHFDGELLVKFSAEIREYDGETIWLSPSEDQVELAQYIYESIVLSMPYQRVHPQGECDPEMLQHFRIISGEEFEVIENNAEKGEEAAAEADAKNNQLAALKEQMEHEEKKKR